MRNCLGLRGRQACRKRRSCPKGDPCRDARIIGRGSWDFLIMIPGCDLGRDFITARGDVICMFLVVGWIVATRGRWGAGTLGDAWATNDGRMVGIQRLNVCCGQRSNRGWTTEIMSDDYRCARRTVGSWSGVLVADFCDLYLLM